MFSYVFMKILEGRPRSYDRRMDRVSRGRVRALKEAVSTEVGAGDEVLEIGCGTGELGAMLITRGARVDGFDLSPTMIETARERIAAEGLEVRLRVWEMGVDGMDTLAEQTYDAVVSTLVLSELSDDERRYALRHAYRGLRPGGRLIVADEVVPRTRARRWTHRAIRAPLLAVTYLVSRSSTRPLADLPGELRSAGFTLDRIDRTHGDTVALVVAHRPKSGAEP
jgi:cyclopropane fatty-acyl-phospholipid synthase-like methyltransferase